MNKLAVYLNDNVLFLIQENISLHVNTKKSKSLKCINTDFAGKNSINLLLIESTHGL